MDVGGQRMARSGPAMRWDAVAAGGVLGAAATLLLLRCGPDPQVLLLMGVLPSTGLGVWWVLTALLAGGLAAGVAAALAGALEMRAVYLHGFTAWALSLLLAAVSGLGSLGVLPLDWMSGLAGLVGAGAGAAAGRAALAGRWRLQRTAVPGLRPRAGAPAPGPERREAPVAAGGGAAEVRERGWRDVLASRERAAGVAGPEEPRRGGERPGALH